MAGADLFDAAAFGVAKAEAVLMDPQQRMVLEAFAAAAGDAVGAPPAGGGAALASAASQPLKQGVYVGVSQLEYARLTLEHGVPLAAYYATGAHLSVTAGRVAFAFNLRGPAISVDTGERACAWVAGAHAMVGWPGGA